MPAIKMSNVTGRKIRHLSLTAGLFAYFIAAYAQAQLDSRYHTYEEMVAEVDSLAALHSDIMRVDSIGVSTHDSMVIWAVKISDNVDLEEDEPAILYNGVHHAEEVLGLEICLSMIQELVSRYGVDPHITWWVNTIEIWFVPLLNPEGHKVVTDGLDVTYRKNKRDNNGNGVFDFIPEIGGDIDGVDPNRNYDFNWERGDTNWATDTYRGPAPFSESENRALRDLATEQKFVFAILYHSARTGTKEVVYYPWCWDEKNPPDFPIIQDTAERVAELIKKDDGLANYSPWCSSLRAPFARDWFYARVGTIPILIEVGSTIHPPGERVDDICERNKVGAYYLLDRVLAGGITVLVNSASTGESLEAEVTILEAAGGITSPRLCDPVYGRYRRILLPGRYTVEVSHPGYRSQRFSDIVVNPTNPTEFHVTLSPLSQWSLAGVVTNASSEAPLEATLIFRGSTVATSHSILPAGDYEVRLYEGFYSIIILSEGYAPRVDSIHIDSETSFDYTLLPADTLLIEGFEGEIGQWTFGGENTAWNVTGSNGHSSRHSLTDSPTGYYPNSGDVWAAMNLGVDLTSYTSAALLFWHECNVEPDYDSAFVEASTDGGLNWLRLRGVFTGASGGWVQEIRFLTSFCGSAKDLRIRFHLVTDGSVDDDGWYIDDVHILAGRESVAIENGRDHPMPQSFHLDQNYPNPFNPATDIRYQIVENRSPLHTVLKIFNVLGQEVRTLVDEVKEPGYYTVTWDGRDNFGQRVGSGIYLYKLEIGDSVQIEKMVLLR